MTLWAVYLWARMYEDRGEPFAVGDQVAWDVILVDGEHQGWPSAALVNTTVRIDGPPIWASRGALAITPELSACWGGPDPVGTTRALRGGLVADLFNPPFRTEIMATVTKLQIVVRRQAPDQSGLWRSLGPWQLRDVDRAPAAFEETALNTEERLAEDGLLATVKILSYETRPWARPSDLGVSNPILDRPIHPSDNPMRKPPMRKAHTRNANAS